MSGNIEFCVRRATEADLDPLVGMVNEAYRKEEDWLEGKRIDLARMRGHFESGAIFVAELPPTGNIVACVFAEPLSAAAPATRQVCDGAPAAGSGYIGMLAVDSAHQGKGLARRMMTTAENHLCNLGCGCAEISVLSLLPELLPLYERLGYAHTGTAAFAFHRKLKPGVECHVVLMAKKL